MPISFDQKVLTEKPGFRVGGLGPGLRPWAGGTGARERFDRKF